MTRRARAEGEPRHCPLLGAIFERVCSALLYSRRSKYVPMELSTGFGSCFPDHVDLAVILTPAHTVPDILDECGRKGIRWAVIETAGFREYGERGQTIEQDIMRVAQLHDIRFIGPNCIGIINLESGLCLPFPRPVAAQQAEQRQAHRRWLDRR